MDITAGISEASRELGYDTLITLTQPNSAGTYIKYVEDGMIGGIILLNIRLLSDFSDSLLAKCPIVQCNEYENVPKANLVTIDNNGATREITEHLIKTGKRRLAFISPQSAFGYPVKFAIDREYGFRQAAEENGLEVNPDFIIRTEFTSSKLSHQEYITGLYAIAEKLLSLPKTKRPDGIVCTHDHMAACCVNVAQKMGIRVPEELAVTAFDNSVACFMTMPNLTSIEQPYYEMGYESAKLLISAIEDKPTIAKRVLLDHQMIVRGSSDASK
jgi:LacI family repressor for deo operon, udp, cdd, tsx, nupC, and nupG